MQISRPDLQPNRRPRSRVWSRRVLAWLGAGLFLAAGCSEGKDQGKAGAGAGQPVPVTIAVAVKKTMPLELTSIGTVEAKATVAVKSQVGGVLTKVHFQEGQHVKKGDLLFTIDRRPFENTVNQLEGVLARDLAQLELFKKEADRNEELLKKNLVSQEDVDQTRAQARAQQAVVKSDRASLQNARLQLGYCSIYSPVEGVSGQYLVDPGNLVQAGGAALVVINQLTPILVRFTAPQQDLPNVQQHQAQGQLLVKALITGDDQPEPGMLTFIDNAVDPATGTILLKGTFGNEDERLWPGQFVNVVLTLAQEPGVVVIPAKAVQSGQQGPYVYVVGPDSTVELKPVVIARTMGEEAVVEKGVESGQTVVTDGQLRLTPGGRVVIKAEPGTGEAPGR